SILERRDGRFRAADTEERQVALHRTVDLMVNIVGERGGGGDPGSVLERIERYIQVPELWPGHAGTFVGYDRVAVALLEQAAHDVVEFGGCEPLAALDRLVYGEF